MFLTFTNNNFKSRFLEVPWTGKVIDNLDPKKIGRIKVEIENLFTGTKEELPWAYPLTPFFLGGSANSSLFSVPEIGSVVEVTFPYKDIYFPMYSGTWENKLTHNAVFDQDYPNTFGFIASDGYKSIHDKTTKKTTTVYPGEVVDTYAGSVTITVEGGQTLTVKGNISISSDGNIDIKAKGTINVSGKGGSTFGDPSSVTKIEGSNVTLGGGGAPVAFVGSRSIGVGNHGMSVISTIIDGSSRVSSG